MLRMFGQSRLFDGGCQQIADDRHRPVQHRLVAALLTGVLWLVFVGRAVYSIRRRFDERLLRRSFACSRQLQHPRAQLRLAVAQRVRLCLEGSECLKVDNIKAQKIPSPSPMATVRCRRSSMRKWRNCTSLHSTVLTQEQADFIGVKVEGPFKGGHYRYSDARFIRGCCRGQRFRFSTAMVKNRRSSRSGRTLRGSSSSAGRPRHESSIAKNYLKSSSIEENCLRSSSTWTSGVHRDKESLPNAKVQKPNCTRLPERTTRLQSFHKSWREDRSSKDSASYQTPSSSSGSAFRLTVSQTRISEQHCCLEFN